jgi:ABC-type lipoprotein release transport system permease subunit
MLPTHEQFRATKTFGSLDGVRVKNQTLDFVLVCAIEVLLFYLGSVYPAHKAASLQPVDAIREG